MRHSLLSAKQRNVCYHALAVCTLIGMPAWHAESNAGETSTLVRNGSMAAGDGTPLHWTETKADAGTVRVVRDTEVFASGPASLRLESVGGPVKSGSVTQSLTGLRPGMTIDVRAQLRADGKVSFAALAVLTPGAQQSWHQVAAFTGVVEWSPHEGRVTIPDNTDTVLLMLLMHGEGRVWLDEVEIVSAAAVQKPPSSILADFDQPNDFAYLSFEKESRVRDGVLRVRGDKSQGGIGFLAKKDLSAFADHSPAIWVKRGAGHRAKEILMFLASGESRRMFRYPLSQVTADQFTPVLPEPALAVSPVIASESESAFDPSRIEMFQVQGDWSQNAVDLYIDKIELIAPTAEMKASRLAHDEELRKKAQRQRQAEERKRQEIERLIDAAPHPEDGPDIRHVAAATVDTLVLTIEAGKIHLRPQVPYEPQAGDEIQPAKDQPNVLCMRDGHIVDEPKGWVVLRKAEDQRKAESLGNYVPNLDLIAPGAEYQGTPMTTATLDQPRAYRIVSTDDPAYRQPQMPKSVHIKSKPTGQATNQISVRHQVFLQLPSSPEPEATYTIQLRGINTRQSSVNYTHDPRKVISPAIHATQIGYRPSDPFKRAYLSLWMGTGGAVTYDSKSFEILDARDGATVYRGNVVAGFPADRVEAFRGNKNHTKSNVYYLDFHTLDQPGTYRVFVPGIGVSRTFLIADNVWQEAFAVSMHGFLSHRSGIKLEPPFTTYRRPRPMHPADGVKVFELDVTFWNGESDAVQRSLRRLLGPNLDESRLQTHPNAWGGYMDAGDWDRRSQHLTATWEHLELLDLFPEFFEKQKLALPPGEANDHLPDVLNEALWNLDFYRRLQRHHGGVGGGVESTSHPRPGEASWQESLLLGTFAPDPESSLRYAACAARAARLIAKYDQQAANEYAASAKKAWQWANANEERVIREETDPARVGRNTDPERLREAVRNTRALAAVALYRLTNEKDYHRAYQASTALSDPRDDPGKQLDSVFAYATLPTHLADAALQRKAIAWFEQAAADSLAFASNTAFDVTCRVPLLPVIGYVSFFSAPETTLGAILPRAHYLTGKVEYLRGALAATQFTAGANPMNMTLTTGVGHAYPRHPLHVDSHHAGIEPPDGVTVYGMGDPSLSDGSVDWVHTWFLSKTMIPGSRTWPTTEFYVDLGNWPASNEYTVHQTFRPVSFYWGYLAARP